MFLTVHASVGALLGESIGNDVAAFGAGFASHFIFDIIPHGDESIGEIFLKSKRHLPLALLFILDFAVAVVLVGGLAVLGVFSNPTAAFSGALGATMPDILSGFSEVTKKILWSWFHKFHEHNHKLLRKPVSVLVGSVIQVFTISIVWLILLRY
jgi:hypothetical protein